jgi:HK97 family phage major capsid protein
MSLHNTETLKLREQQAELHEAAKREYEALQKPDLSDGEVKEIEARWDKAMGQFDEIQTKLDRMEKLDGMRGRLESGLTPVPNQDAEARGSVDGKTSEYREVFEKMVRFGPTSLDKEERAVFEKEGFDHEQRAQSTGTGSEGGFFVPEGFSNEIDVALKAYGPLLDGSVVRRYDTASGNPIPWPTVDDTNQTGDLLAENAAATDDGSKDFTVGSETLSSYGYNSGIVRVPLQLLRDSAFNMDSLLADLFSERMGRTGNTALTTGTGSNQPQGLVTGASAGNTTASATAITSDEVIDLQHEVDPAYRMSPKAAWMFNDSTLKAVRKLKDGQGNYLWMRGDVSGGVPNTLLDKPYHINQAMANIATATNPIVFGDLNRFVVRRIGNYQLVTFREKYMNQLQVGYQGFMFIDGRVINSSAIKKLVMA